MLKKTAFLLVAASVSLAAQAQAEKANPLSFEGSYVGDSYYNMTGGLATGGGFMGMANLTVGFDTEAAGWWRGGSFFVNGASIHGKSLTENYLGDMQVASNIDAGEYAYLHELWYRQQLGAVSITLGLQDLNAEFMVSEGAGEFLNSSFGVPPVIATGIPVPIFPLTGLGVSARWEIGEQWAVQAALFDGNQTPFDRNPHNIRWRFGRDDGLLTMGEVHYDGRFKAGAYYHSADGNYGFYALADQPLTDRLSLFGQLAIAPKSKNDNNYSIGLGANWFIAEQHALGLAATYAGLHAADHRHETALELYYKFTLNDHIALQPDFQYILNPSGTETKLPNALVGMLRVYMNFGL
ncbi:MAG: carbohydrate porin [Rikenellaceae bacterium]|jgi:porin|nr:carbohydrate porin [Rikenellaceae bacterium]